MGFDLITQVVVLAIVLVAMTIVGLLMLIVVWRMRRQWKADLGRKHISESEARRCLACGYIVEGLDIPRCPECGAVIGFTKAFDELGIGKEEIHSKRHKSTEQGH